MGGHKLNFRQRLRAIAYRINLEPPFRNPTYGPALDYNAPVIMYVY